MKRIIHILLIMAALAACLVPARAEDLSGFDGAAFSPLDGHGRAGSALAVLSADTLDDTRYSISMHCFRGSIQIFLQCRLSRILR